MTTLLFYVSTRHTVTGTDKANGPQRVVVRVGNNFIPLWLRIATSKDSLIGFRERPRTGEIFLNAIEI